MEGPWSAPEGYTSICTFTSGYQPAPALTIPPTSVVPDESVFTVDAEKSKSLGRTKSDMQLMGNAFEGAHGFTIGNATFLHIPQNDAKATDILYQRAFSDALLHSSARFPPPSCLEGTRQEVRSRIWTWLTNPGRNENLLWVCGPTGAGKSAIAQTITKDCEAKGWLGAAIFFARLKSHQDPTRVIPTLAYQLAIAYPAYKVLVTLLLDHSPSILEEALPVQFEKLIAKPLLSLQARTTDPLLILLDGLDHCREDTFQRELIELIGKFAAISNHLRLPFVWIITSRKEWQISSAFDTANPPIQHRREVLQIHTTEAQDDVARFIRHGFQKFRNAYDDILIEVDVWPSEDQLETIAFRASGFFGFASAILKFVDSDNPEVKLMDCLEYLERGVIPGAGNPLLPLYSLYHDVLDAVAPDILPTTKRVLSFLALGAHDIPAQAVADFLSLPPSTLYAALRRLHSVLGVPSPNDRTTSTLSILHSSFGDYVKNMIGSGDFDLDVVQTRAGTVSSIEEHNMKIYSAWKQGDLTGG